MLERVRIVNFQSLKDISLELGPFTVIVGSSSSGKSAFIRAIKAVASNPRGSSFVTYGEKIALISVEGSDWIVSLSRGEGHGEYRTLQGSEEKVFTKLAGAVPEAVIETLKFSISEEGIGLAFAGQFDAPYLLSSSGTAVASSLGSLTKVNEIIEAAREANRRRLGISSTRKIREEDLSNLQQEITLFPDLVRMESRVVLIEDLYTEFETKAKEYSSLKSLVDKIDNMTSRIQEIPNLPDSSFVASSLTNYESLQIIVSKVQNLLELVKTLDNKLKELTSSYTNMEDRLKNLGICPLCERTF